MTMRRASLPPLSADSLTAARTLLYSSRAKQASVQSAMAADLINTATEMNVVAVLGAGEEIDSGSPYHAWQAVLAQLLGLSDTVDPNHRRARVLEMLDAPESLQPFLSLLNGALDVDFPETEQTIAMSPRARRHQIAGMLVRLLERSAAGSRLLIVLEDAHCRASLGTGSNGRTGHAAVRS